MLTQGKDDDKEKWQNSRREACYTLSIEGMFSLNTSLFVTQIIFLIIAFKYNPGKTVEGSSACFTRNALG